MERNNSKGGITKPRNLSRSKQKRTKIFEGIEYINEHLNGD